MNIDSKIQKLPEDIQNKIVGYLYFNEDNKCLQFKKINNLIKSHSYIIYYEMKKLLPVQYLYKMILRYILLDINVNTYNMLNEKKILNYELTDETRQDKHNIRIMENISFFKRCHLYNYIIS